MNAQTVPIWKQIEDLVHEIPGWSPIDQLYSLFMMVFTAAPNDGDIIEVGSWCGRSSCVLGFAAQITGAGTVHCIDLFPAKNDWFRNADGSWSFSVEIEGVVHAGYQDQTVWADPFERDIVPVYARDSELIRIFEKMVRKADLQTAIRAHRGTLETFAATAAPDLKCKLAFLDGDHSYAGLSDDIARIERFLVPGGWLCFDDAFTQYGGVDQAIREHVLDSGRYDRCQQLTRKFFVAQRRK